MTFQTLTLTPCAKINLTLDVFSIRSDGYHSLASVFQTVSLCDTLRLTKTPEPTLSFTCTQTEGIEVPADPTNLVYRAAKRLWDATAAIGVAIPHGVARHLDKQIPAQAGLGGGSSDAAATLIGMNALFDWHWEPKALAEFAAELGSDVPFFLMGGTAVARGRGEILTPLPDAPTLWLVIVKPEEGVSTGWAYGALDAATDRVSHRGTKRLEDALAKGDYDRFIAWQSNDFELPVFEHHPRLAWLHDELRMAGAVTAHLCGSGSAIYGVAQNETEAHRIANLLRTRYPKTFVARSLRRSEANPLSAPAS